MPYKPTGRPPGRPKAITPADPENAPEPYRRAVQRVSKAEGWLGPQPAHLCEDCYPDGWPEGYTGLGCPHGIWTRRL